ncbi:PIG-L deacetylase family protein [Methanobacterium formicicum]|uniref:Lmbe family protein n=1 Tax=Methanobacterium formicicum (strain DSM 3637 / PP1) TaxID=1204725 RepID=K2Q9K9_METFP|nr:PIG-L family deacetylase [Methanobacterium formicicum]EKF84656.1 lmbe family protein [Methanobacterium formicicum DSM 3637]
MGFRDPKFNFSKLVPLLLLFIILSFVFLFYMSFSTDGTTDYSDFPEIHSSDRILIIAPHADDESVAAAGLIKRTLEKNATVEVVVMTDGSASDSRKEFSDYLKKIEDKNRTETLPNIRHMEVLNALNKIGLNQSNVIFLGYPDGGLRSMWQDNWDSKNPYQSNNAFNKLNHSIYNFTYQPNVSYSGENVNQNLEQIMTDFHPNIILYPDSEDKHPDHWATGNFVRYAALETNYSGMNYTYIVHSGSNWPSPLLFSPKLSLLPPSNLDTNEQWLVLPLDQTEIDTKYKAIDSYQSQLTGSCGYLKSFIRSNELFAVDPPLKIEKINVTIYSLNDTVLSPYTISNSNDQIPDNKTDGLISFHKSYNFITYEKILSNNTTAFSSSEYLLKNNNSHAAQEDNEPEVRAVLHDNQSVYIIIDAANATNRDLIINYHFRIYNGKDFKRVDVMAKNGHVQYIYADNNSIKLNKSPEIEYVDNEIVLKLPVDVFHDFNAIMMGFDILRFRTRE